jgi:glycerol kinase
VFHKTEQLFPKPGWVEHDPKEIWSSKWLRCRSDCKSGITGKKLLQSGSLINVKRRSFGIGKPANLYNAIVWQDRRTAKYCDELKAAGYANLIQKRLDSF